MSKTIDCPECSGFAEETRGIIRCEFCGTRRRSDRLIRRSQTYRILKGWLSFVRDNRDNPLKMVEELHRVKDNSKGYHSKTNSLYAEESLGLLVKDVREGRI